MVPWNLWARIWSAEEEMSIQSGIQGILSTLQQDFQSWEQQLFGSGSSSSSSGSDLETLFLEMLLAQMLSDGSNSSSLFGNSSNQPVLDSGSAQQILA
jgi:hypothetical protein